MTTKPNAPAPTLRAPKPPTSPTDWVDTGPAGLRHMDATPRPRGQHVLSDGTVRRKRNVYLLPMTDAALVTYAKDQRSNVSAVIDEAVIEYLGRRAASTAKGRR